MTLIVMRKGRDSSKYRAKPGRPEFVQTGTLTIDYNEVLRFICDPDYKLTLLGSIEICRDVVNQHGDRLVDISATASDVTAALIWQRPEQEPITIAIQIRQAYPAYLCLITGYSFYDSNMGELRYASVKGYVNEELFGTDKLPINSRLTLPAPCVGYADSQNYVTITNERYPRMLNY